MPLLVAGLALVAAYPTSLNKMRFRATLGKFVDPVPPADKRGPCPFINLLANHGALPHNGNGITKDDLKAALKTLGISWPLRYLFASAFPKFLAADGKMSLELMVKPLAAGGLEHFGSMSRADVKVQADQTKPNLERVMKNVENMGLKDAPDTTAITLDHLLKAREFILKESETLNPDLKTAKDWGKHKFIGLAETCLLLGVGGGQNGVLTKAGYISILGHSKLPDGYQPNNSMLGYGLTNVLACFAKAKWKEGDYTMADAGHFGVGVEPKEDPDKKFF